MLFLWSVIYLWTEYHFSYKGRWNIGRYPINWVLFYYRLVSFSTKGLSNLIETKKKGIRSIFILLWRILFICPQKLWYHGLISVICSSYQRKKCRWRPAFALETGGPSNTDGQDFDECWHRIAPTHSNALEHAGDRQNDLNQRCPGGPVWPVWSREPLRPRNASSGGTPSELARLGLLWGRQATQNVFKRRRDERRKQSRVGKD